MKYIMLSDRSLPDAEKLVGKRLLAIPGAIDNEGNRTKYTWLHSAGNENERRSSDITRGIFQFMNFCDSFPPLADDEIFKEHFLNGQSREHIFSSGIGLSRSDVYWASFTFFRQGKDAAKEQIEEISGFARSNENDLLVKHYKAYIETCAISNDSRMQRLLTLCLLPLTFRNYFIKLADAISKGDIKELQREQDGFVYNLATALTIELSEDLEKISEDSLFHRENSLDGFNEMHSLIKDTLAEKCESTQLKEPISSLEEVQTIWISTLKELSQKPLFAKLSSKLNIIADNIEPFFSQLPKA